LIPIFIPSANPRVNAGAIHLQSLGDLTGGPLPDAEHDGLQSQSHTGRFVGLGCLAERLEPLESSRIALGEDGLHGGKRYVVLLIRTQVHHTSAPPGKQKGHLKSAQPFLEIHLGQ
jgi:hypothetical protein